MFLFVLLLDLSFFHCLFVLFCLYLFWCICCCCLCHFLFSVCFVRVDYSCFNINEYVHTICLFLFVLNVVADVLAICLISIIHFILLQELWWVYVCVFCFNASNFNAYLVGIRCCFASFFFIFIKLICTGALYLFFITIWFLCVFCVSFLAFDICRFYML